MKKNKSLKEVKKLLKSTQSALENGLKKQLVRYDDIKDERERKKAKETFLVAYQSVFNDSINAVIKEVVKNTALERKIEESGKTLEEIGSQVFEYAPVANMMEIIENRTLRNLDVRIKIAKSLGCKVGEIFN